MACTCSFYSGRQTKTNRRDEKKSLHKYMTMWHKPWSVWAGHCWSVSGGLDIKGVAGQQKVDELLLTLSPAGSLWWGSAGRMSGIQHSRKWWAIYTTHALLDTWTFMKQISNHCCISMYISMTFEVVHRKVKSLCLLCVLVLLNESAHSSNYNKVDI